MNKNQQLHKKYQKNKTKKQPNMRALLQNK